MTHTCYRLQTYGITPMKQAALNAALMPWRIFDLNADVKSNNTLEYTSFDIKSWDSRNTDMLSLSKMFHDVDFVLIYDEDRVPKWVFCYRNGKLTKSADYAELAWGK